MVFNSNLFVRHPQLRIHVDRRMLQLITNESLHGISLLKYQCIKYEEPTKLMRYGVSKKRHTFSV